MKHAGKAFKAGLKLIIWSLVLLFAVMLGGFLAALMGSLILALSSLLIGLWVIFLLFVLYFFRDPNSQAPADPKAIVSPAYGIVDLIDETSEGEFMGGACRRVSIFLSVIDVHVQKAPVSGTVAYFRYCPGQFLNALRTDCGMVNENVLFGIESSQAPGEKIAVRLIAGVLARRIVPWVAVGDILERGERTSLIQFGSRVDLYLPLSATVAVKLGNKVKGGETIVATR